MHLKCRVRHKDGKEHRTWSIVESRRVAGRVVHHHVLYLGEVNDRQRASWEKAVSVVDENSGAVQQMELLPEDRQISESEVDAVRVRLSAMSLERPRQWGACWLADTLWRELHLDGFFGEKLGSSREGTDWEKVLRVLVIYRLLSPGSEWRLHRQWFGTTALPDLLGVDERAVQPATLYRCLDLLLANKEALFAHLRERWRDLFAARYEILLYDLTSTYFECDVPEDENDPRRFGYSRDRRSDCVQVVIALVVTPEGLPLAYEMLPGNTADKTTLLSMLELVQKRHGQAQRIWVMDRGVPTEAALEQMRAGTPPVHYLVGTPKGRLSRMEAALSERPWVEVRAQLRVKCVSEDGEVYVLTESPARVSKERSMRRRAMKKYWKRLGELCGLKATKRDELLLKLGKAAGEAGAAARLIDTAVSPQGVLTYRLNREKLRIVRSREGRYLLRTNLTDYEPDVLWRYYMQLVFVEEACCTLKGYLAIRPVYHQKPDRIESHLFVAFLAYCLSITLRQQLRGLAGGIMPRSVFEKLATVQMLDVRVPTTDGRELLLIRRTEPASDVTLVLQQLRLELPAQPPPRIRTPAPVKSAL
ncbi:MAG TPA: IS1634 family transposase [Opitutaceae bacterium]|nr:IS1634 family transposase [Opitutaceae bacterium]